MNSFSVKQATISCLVMLMCIGSGLFAQTESTQKLHDKYEDAFTMFFYKSTLKMLAPDDNEEFKNVIQGIEKAKLLRIKKDHTFDEEDVESYLAGIRDESFEEIMTVRQGGHNMNVFLKEKNGETRGLVLLVNEEESFNILDIVGSIDLSQLTLLTKKIDF